MLAVQNAPLFRLRTSTVWPKRRHPLIQFRNRVQVFRQPPRQTGHLRATLRDGSVVEERQPYLRGGAQEPLTRQDVVDKFLLNAEHGGWSNMQAETALKLMGTLYNGRIDLSSLRG